MGLSDIGLARLILASVTLTGIVINSSTAIAGATAPQQPQVRIDLRDASIDTIRLYILDSCVIREWGTTTTNKHVYADRCKCYAYRITKEMTNEEVESFRQTGTFSASARPKAEAAQLKCGLK